MAPRRLAAAWPCLHGAAAWRWPAGTKLEQLNTRVGCFRTRERGPWGERGRWVDPGRRVERRHGAWLRSSSRHKWGRRWM